MHTEWKKDGAIFNAVPKTLIEFAKNHKSTVGIICYRDAFGMLWTANHPHCTIHLQHFLQSEISFYEEKMYNSGMAFTKNKLLCFLVFANAVPKMIKELFVFTTFH